MTQKAISVVVRVRNAEKDLLRCLSLLRKQDLPEGSKLEIIVVDNDSVDGSVDVAQAYGAKIIFLTTEEFTWGRALNRGIAAAAGDIILLLSADAYPAGHNWVIEMIRPFEDQQIAAVYGRQIPRTDAPIDEIVRLRRTFGNSTLVARELPKDFSSRGGAFPVSNACAAIRKKIWEEIPYDEEIAGGEEGIWTYGVFQKGFFVTYQATAQVYHSHNDSPFRGAWRNLELVKKNIELNDKKVNVFTYFRFLLSKSKKRISNSFSPGISLHSRLKGLLILPIEVVAFCFVAFFFHCSDGARKYRSYFWNK